MLRRSSQRCVGPHQVGEETFMRLAQLGQRHRKIAVGQFEYDAVLDRPAERIDRHVGAVRSVEEVGEAGVADGDEIEALILAEKAFGNTEGLGSTSGAPASRGTRRSGRSPIRCASCRECSRARPPARRSA